MKALIALMLLSTAALADVNEVDNNKTHAVALDGVLVAADLHALARALEHERVAVAADAHGRVLRAVDGVRLVVVDLVDVGERRRREEHQRDERLHGLIPRLAASVMGTTGASASASASASLAIPCGASRSHSAAWTS